jgi:hypothetical protein
METTTLVQEAQGALHLEPPIVAYIYKYNNIKKMSAMAFDCQ